jgi:predicted extracellular nuclease
MLHTETVPFRRLLVLALSLALLSGMLPLLPASPVRAVTSVWINEIHYDNTGTDTAEMVELGGPANMDLTGWSLVLYNGNGGAPYREILLTGAALSDEFGGGVGLAPFDVAGLQNDTDGLALVNGTTVVQFLSYEGSFTAVGGPANGQVSTDIGQDEDPAPAAGLSLQLRGTGSAYEHFTWAPPAASTPGGPNQEQVFGTPDNLPVSVDCGPALTALQGAAATRTITATDADGTVDSIAFDGPSPHAGITISATTPATTPGGTASAVVTVAATTPPGSYPVAITATNTDATPQTADCVLSVTVAVVRTVGEVQGPTLDTENGATDASPLVGQTVFVRGVVTQRMRFPTSFGSQRYGLFLQSAVGATDGDPNSSDGMFVFMNFSPFMARVDGGEGDYFPVVGDQVVLRGPVRENFNQTELGTATNSPVLVARERTGVSIATEIEMTEATPADSLDLANRFWERHEGMRLHLDAGAFVVAARDGFPSTKDAEVWVVRGDHPIANRTDPYARLVYRDPHPLDDIGPAGSFDNGNGMRIMLQSHGLKWLAVSNDPLVAPANTFDTVTTAHTGGLYFAFSKYGIEVEQQLELERGIDPAGNAPPSPVQVGEEFSTSDYNVENLYDFRDDPFDGCDFTGNLGCTGVDPPFDYVPASEEAYQKHLVDLAQQIAGPLHAPDLLMIQEAEDQDLCTVSGDELVCGTADNADGKPDTIQELALAVRAAGGPTYDAAYDRDGADDRGIVSAFLFRTDTVELLPADSADPVLGSAPTVDYRGAPLAYNSQVSNPKVLNAVLPTDVPRDTGTDGGNVYTRPPQVGHFRVWRDGIGTSVFTDLYALSNHFSSGPDGRVGQRTEQAAYNVAIAEALEAGGANRVISAGDFNVYPRPDDPFAPGQQYACNPLPCSIGPSDQLGPMYSAGLHNLWDTLVAEVPQSAYSYNFVGMVQTLDMQWATDAQFDDLVQVRAAHLNADFAADFDGDVARGASDHDPQVARWFTDVTLERLHDLVDYYVAAGDLAGDKAFLFHDRLDKAGDYFAAGKLAAYAAQLQAFGNQAHEYASPLAADSLEKEADRLAAS